MASSSFAQAASYAPQRRSGLSAFLSNPNAAIDTHHLERGFGVIPMSRKNWLLCATLLYWSELGAEMFGKIQSALMACKLHGIKPDVYIVAVLRRIGSYPVSDVDCKDSS